MRTPRTEDLPDVLPLRGADGAVLGLFSDHGSWLCATWGEGGLLDLHGADGGRVAGVGTDVAVRERRVWPDHLEATLADGRTLRIGYTGPESLFVRCDDGVGLRALGDVPVRRVRGGWQIGAAHDLLPPDALVRNRQRWNGYLARAHAAVPERVTWGDPELLGRAVTTLLWNWRGPRGELQHAGVVPSPFAYRGLWGWDSWKHAHALARFAPALAAEQLRAQLSRQREDGMVADTVMPRAADDNWRNSKPALAAWALEECWRHGGDRQLVAELLPRCAAFSTWWDAQRRLPGATLHSCGGVDHETATWDSGQDLSARFDGVPLVEHGGWHLLDLWPVDLAAYHLAEHEALARLAAEIGGDTFHWRRRARSQAAALSGTWDRALGAFCDRRPGGDGRGVLSAACLLPVWAGAASPQQRRRTRELLRDAAHFDTPMPFPALARSQRGFDPDGYWNGSVWLDLAALALIVLEGDASEPRRRLLKHVGRHRTFYECYHPLSGEPAAGARPAVAQFSWSAAAVLEMLWDGPRAAS